MPAFLRLRQENLELEASLFCVRLGLFKPLEGYTSDHGFISSTENQKFSRVNRIKDKAFQARDQCVSATMGLSPKFVEQGPRGHRTSILAGEGKG